jgi:hypothetical protein
MKNRGYYEFFSEQYEQTFYAQVSYTPEDPSDYYYPGCSAQVEVHYLYLERKNGELVEVTEFFYDIIPALQEEFLDEQQA